MVQDNQLILEDEYNVKSFSDKGLVQNSISRL